MINANDANASELFEILICANSTSHSEIVHASFIIFRNASVKNIQISFIKIIKFSKTHTHIHVPSE